MPSYNHFIGDEIRQSGPASNFVAITPSNSADLPFRTSAIYVGGEGDIAVRNETTGQIIVFKSLPTGSIVPVETLRVLSTNTTATNLVALG